MEAPDFTAPARTSGIALPTHGGANGFSYKVATKSPRPLDFFSAHPTEGCAGGFQGMAQASNDNLCELSLDLILGLPGETELSSAEVQLDKGYPGRRCANGADGSWRVSIRRGRFY